ncbi:sarcosine oxidase, subunit beta [Anaerolineae bacterium]|nr:sarcosine oxidase, subunit beta [Anaerolineae bacterium]
MNRFADVVIVGAGVMGCSAAFHLARGTRGSEIARPSGARVVVVEKGSVASGMTKRSGGLVRASFSDETQAALAQASLEYFRDWKNSVGGSCGFTRTGLLVLANETGAARLRAMVDHLGADTRVVSADELCDLQPGVRVQDVALAAHEPDAGYVDPLATTQTLAARAKEWGVEFRTGTLVKHIRVEGGRVVGVETTTGAIETFNVVVMAGAWSARLLKPLGIEMGITTTRVQVVFFDRPAELKTGHHAFVDTTTGAYFRPHSFGLTFAGVIEAETNTVNPDHFDETVAPEFVDDVRARIATRLPAFTNARFVRGHTGVYDLTPDTRPIISRVPGIAGLIVAAGFGGDGFAFAPAVGACVAEMVTDGAARTVDVSEFSLIV